MAKTIILDGMKKVSFHFYEGDSGPVVEARASLTAGAEEIHTVARLLTLSGQQQQKVQAVFDELRALLVAQEL